MRKNSIGQSNQEGSDMTAPHFAKQDDAQSQARPLEKTSKSVPVIQDKRKRSSNTVKYDSVLNIQANISERSGSGVYNPFKENYRQSKTSEDF